MLFELDPAVDGELEQFDLGPLGLKKHIEMITLSNPILKTRTRLVGSGISRSFGFEISSSGTWNGYAAQQNNNAKMTP